VLDSGQHVGNYEVLSELGGGGFARVFHARHRFLDTEHAIKVLLVEHVTNPSLRGRFLDEARVQALLRHRSIVRVTDVLIEPGIAGIVMDYMPGGNLADWLERAEEPPSPAMLRQLLVPVLDAVGHAHEFGVVHRDLKPENILLGEPLAPRVMDFGVAKVEGELRDGRGSKRTTAAHTRIGTLAYMSPEQIRDAAAVDHRSDIFSLGTLLLELMTLRCPFERDTDYDTMHAIISGDVELPADVVRADPAAADAVRCALQLDPADRYASCAAFARALGGGEISAAGPSSPPASTQQRIAPVALKASREHREPASPVLPEPHGLPPQMVTSDSLPPTPEHRQELTVLRTPLPVGDRRLCEAVTSALRRSSDEQRRVAVALRHAVLAVLQPVSTGPALGIWSPHPMRGQSRVSLTLLPGKESAARRLVFERRGSQLLLCEEWWLPEVHMRGAWNMWLELRWAEQQSSSSQIVLADLILEQLDAQPAPGPFPLLPRRQLLDPRALDITNYRMPVRVGDGELAQGLRPWLAPRVPAAARYVAAVSLRAALLDSIGLPGAGPALDLRAEPGDSVSLWLLPGAEVGPRRFTLRYARKDQLVLAAEWRTLDSRHGPRPSVRQPATPERTHVALEAHAVWRDRVLDELQATGTSTVGGLYPV